MSDLETRRQAIVRALSGAFPARPTLRSPRPEPAAALPAPIGPQSGADPVEVADLRDSVAVLARRVDTLAEGLADVRRELHGAPVDRAQPAGVCIPRRPVTDETSEEDGPQVSVPPLRLDRQNSTAFDVLLGSGSG